MSFLSNISKKIVFWTDKKDNKTDKKDNKREIQPKAEFQLPIEMILGFIQFFNINEMNKYTRVSKKFKAAIFSVLPMYVNDEIYRRASPRMQSLCFEDLVNFYSRINVIDNTSTTKHQIKTIDFFNKINISCNDSKFLIKKFADKSETIKTLILANTKLFAKCEKDGLRAWVPGTGLYFDSEFKNPLQKVIEIFKQLEVLTIQGENQTPVGAILTSVSGHPTLKKMITDRYTIDLTVLSSEEKIAKFIEITDELLYNIWSQKLLDLTENNIECLSNIKYKPTGIENLEEIYTEKHLKISSKISWFANLNKMDEEKERLERLFEIKEDFKEFEMPQLLSLEEKHIEVLINIFNQTKAKTDGLVSGAGFDTHAQPGLHLTPLFAGVHYHIIHQNNRINNIFEETDPNKNLLTRLFQTNFFVALKNLDLRFDNESWFGKSNSDIYLSNMQVIIPIVLQELPDLETLSFCGMYCTKKVVNPLLETLCDESVFPNLRAVTLTRVDYNDLDFEKLLNLHARRRHLHITITKDSKIKCKFKMDDYIGNYGDTVDLRKKITKLKK